MKPAIGTILDNKYRIVRELGTGGMGAVYEGENTRIRRRVAIKLLHASVSSQEEAVKRFEREAQAAAQIGSDHICEVLDMGVLHDGTRYMVMEYLEGETLGARIKRSGRIGPLMIVPVMAQVLDALYAAHNAGIIHRDLKPDNIFLLPMKNGIPDFVKILDFGVSKFAQSSEEMNMTRAGAVVGTPYYMSPEQARGTSAIDARSDIYALGVLLYQAVTGQVPFQAQTFNELLFKIVLEPAPPPQQYAPDLDPEFTAIIQKAMAREPPQRFQTCAEFKEALMAWMASRVGVNAMPLGQGRSPTVPPTGGMQRPAIPGAAPSQLTQSQPPWATASGTGGQAPNPLAVTPLPQAQQTANAWGNASQSGQQVAKPPRSGLAAGVIAAAVIALLGGGGAAIFFMTRSQPKPVNASTPSASAVAVVTATSATPTPDTAPTPTETQAPASAAPPESAAPTSSVAVETPSAATAARTPGTAGGGKKPPVTPTTKPTTKPVPGDFGY